MFAHIYTKIIKINVLTVNIVNTGTGINKLDRHAT